MSGENGASRRGFLQSAGLLAAVAGTGLAPAAEARTEESAAPVNMNAVEPFYGKRQGGIVTPAQRHSYFAAFDLDSDKRDDIVTLLRNWTKASADMTQGKPSGLPAMDGYAAGDSTE